jgi:hypothetical protein
MEFEGKEPISNKHKEIESKLDKSLNSFKDKEGIAPNTGIRIVDEIHQPDGFIRLNVSYMGEYPLNASELKEDVFVSTPLTAELYLDGERNLIQYKTHHPDTAMINSLKDELDSKLKDGQICITENDTEGISGAELFSKQKPFYIQRDAQGKQHLKRAYFN